MEGMTPEERDNFLKFNEAFRRKEIQKFNNSPLMQEFYKRERRSDLIGFFGALAIVIAPIPIGLVLGSIGYLIHHL